MVGHRRGLEEARERHTVVGQSERERERERRGDSRGVVVRMAESERELKGVVVV
jgi:hypothetical protein